MAAVLHHLAISLDNNGLDIPAWISTLLVDFTHTIAAYLYGLTYIRCVAPSSDSWAFGPIREQVADELVGPVVNLMYGAVTSESRL